MGLDKKKMVDVFLAMVFPIVIIYTTILCLWSYFIKTDEMRGDVLDMLVIFICSFLITHGILSILFKFKKGFLEGIKRAFFLQ